MTSGSASRLGRGVVVLKRHNFSSRFFEFDPEFGQDSTRQSITLSDEAKQKVLCAYIVVVEVSGLIVSKVNHALGSGGQSHVLVRPCVSPWELLFDLGSDAVEANPELF